MRTTRQPSLRRNLLAWTLGALGVVWISFIVVGYRTGMHEADELTDGHLASVAALLLSQRTEGFRPMPDTAELTGRPELRAHDYQQSLSVVVWDAAGNLLARTGQAPTPAFQLEEGFETLTLDADHSVWRAFSRWDRPAHQRKIMVLLSLDERDGLAEDIAEQVAGPGLWLMPVVALVLIVAIRRGLRPLKTLTDQVHRLDIHHDTALEAPPHEEFKAVVHAVNTLIERYTAALSRERELASEFAHELRTPLASLRLHATSLDGRLSPQERDEALRLVRKEAHRAASVLDDLLSLARASRAELAETAVRLDVSELVRRVAADYGQLALDSGHDLSVDTDGTCWIDGHAVLLELSVRNLIDNALSHTPSGTSVQVRVCSSPVAIEVEDNGGALATETPQGLTPQSRRHLGLGLGHQVVRRVAAVHGGWFGEQPSRVPGGRRYQLLLKSHASDTLAEP